MKKIFFAVVFTAITMTGAKAQTFGVKTGYNISGYRFSGSNTEVFKDTQTNIPGFAVGGFAEFKLSDKFSFQPELLFSTQGSEHSESGNTWSIKDSYKTSYINMPLIAKYYIADGLSIQFGPQIGFLLHAKDNYVYSGIIYDSGSKNITKLYKTLDFGVDFGAGYKLDNGFSVDLRYNLGLSNIDNDNRIGSNNNKIFNNVIQFTIGYALSK